MITRINSKKKEKTRAPLSLGFFKDPRTRVVAGLIFMLFSIYLFVSLAGFFFTGGMDQSLIDKETRELVTNPDIVVGNPGRKLGAYLSDLLVNRWFGVASFIFCYILFIIGLGTMGRPVKNTGKKIILSFVLVIWISLLLGYIFNFVPSGYVFPGGAHGYFVCFWLNSFIGEIGTFFLLLVSFAVILFFGFENAFNKCVGIVKAYFARRAQRKEERKAAREALAQRETGQTEDEEKEIIPSLANDIAAEAPTEYEFYSDKTEAEQPEEEDPEDITTLFPPENEKILSLDDDEPEDEKQDLENTLPSSSDDIELTVMADKLEEQLTKNLMPDTEYDPTLDLSNYQYPPLDLLEEYSSSASKVTAEELEENKNTIVETLRQYYQD